MFCAVQTDENAAAGKRKSSGHYKKKSYYSIYGNDMQIIRNIYTKRIKKSNHRRKKNKSVK